MSAAYSGSAPLSGTTPRRPSPRPASPTPKQRTWTQDLTNRVRNSTAQQLARYLKDANVLRQKKPLNRSLMAAQFLHVFARGLFRPFYPMLLAGLGIPPLRIGITFTAQLVCEMAVRGWWLSAAGKWRLHHRLWRLLWVLSIVPVVMMPSIKEESVVLGCSAFPILLVRTAEFARTCLLIEIFHVGFGCVRCGIDVAAICLFDGSDALHPGICRISRRLREISIVRCFGLGGRSWNVRLR